MGDIAVVGMSCRFPGANDVGEFWQLLRNARPQFAPLPTNRWDNAPFYDPTTRRDPHRAYTETVAFLDGVDEFAAAYFKIPPSRARAMDPQQRLLLALAREALQDAGMEAADARPSRCGVFVGLSAMDHRQLTSVRSTTTLLMADAVSAGRSDARVADAVLAAADAMVIPLGPYSLAGCLPNMAPATVSRAFNLSGPSFAVDAACSSSLVALHQAVSALRSGGCDSALAGGVFLNLTPDVLIAFSRAGALSPAGVCRPYDERADGFVLGEGGGLLVLRRLEDAVRDGDRVYAVIRGTGLSNDGASEGPMTPTVNGQVEAMLAAYRDAGVDPRTVGLLEGHGAGTRVGDQIEIQALAAVRGGEGRDETQCALGSVKALIGHSLAAAGAAALIKATLALYHRTIPAQPAYEARTDSPFAAAGVRVPSQAEAWEQPSAHARRAAVSSVGFGGTNAHVVLEEAPPAVLAAPANESAERVDVSANAMPELFVLTSQTRSLLARHCAEVAAALRRLPPASIASVAATLRSRELLPARVAFVAATLGELLDRLDAAQTLLAAPDGGGTGPIAVGESAGRPRVCLLFPGHGSHSPRMLEDLYARSPHVRELATRLDRTIGLDLGAVSLNEALLSPAGDQLTDPRTAHPALTLVGVATASLLERLGVVPDLALGHSVGEFAAAVSAGVIDPETTMDLLVARGSAFVGGADSGDSADEAMLAVRAPAADVTALVAGIDGAWLGCDNAPQLSVVSGTSGAVGDVEARCRAAGITTARLPVSRAFHTPLVTRAETSVSPLLDGVDMRKPTRHLVSSVSGRSVSSVEELRELWRRHTQSRVLFRSAVRAAQDAGTDIFVQVSGGEDLLLLARESLDEPDGTSFVALSGPAPDAGRTFLTGIARLLVRGVPVDLAELPHTPAVRTTLPPSLLATTAYSLRRTSPPPAAASRGARPRHQEPPAAPFTGSTPAAPGTPPAPEEKSMPASPDRIASVPAQRQERQPAATATAYDSKRVAPPTSAAPGLQSVVELLREQVALLGRLSAGAVPEPAAPGDLVSPPAPRALVPAATAASGNPVAPVASSLTRREALATLSRVSGVPVESLRPELRLSEDLGLDSLLREELFTLLSESIEAGQALPTLGSGASVGDVLALLPSGDAETAVPVERETEARPAGEQGDVARLPEVVAFRHRVEEMTSLGLGNPYFLVHDGLINDRTRVEGRELISFSSYNYLGLSGHEAVSRAAVEAVERYGTSVSAARILSGERQVHRDLEASIASLLHAEAAVALVSGHATNMSVIGHLVGPEDLVVHDSLAHDSILQGCRLSHATRRTFRHNDVAALRQLLGELRPRFRRVLIVVEGVYSMDGDIADLPGLVDVKRDFDALLMVDEAHSIGVLGATGGGIQEHWGVPDGSVDVLMGTLSKSLASCGGYLAGRGALIEYLRYTLPGFIFSAGMPPATAGAALAALRVMKDEPERLDRLRSRSDLFLRLLREGGVDTGVSSGTPIVPCLLRSSTRSLRLAQALFDRAVSVNPILYPAVSEELARLRFFITSEHTEDQITRAAAAVVEEHDRLRHAEGTRR